MPYPTARSESGLAGRRSSAPMKRNECGTEEDLLPYLRQLASQAGGCESFLRAALALRVFAERGLISLTVRGDRLALCLNPIQGKVDLFACPYLARLHDAADRNRGDRA